MPEIEGWTVLNEWDYRPVAAARPDDRVAELVDRMRQMQTQTRQAQIHFQDLDSTMYHATLTPDGQWQIHVPAEIRPTDPTQESGEQMHAVRLLVNGDPVDEVEFVGTAAECGDWIVAHGDGTYDVIEWGVPRWAPQDAPMAINWDELDGESETDAFMDDLLAEQTHIGRFTLSGEPVYNVACACDACLYERRLRAAIASRETPRS